MARRRTRNGIPKATFSRTPATVATRWRNCPSGSAADATTRRVLMFAVLAHDFAKPQTTHQAERDGRMRIVSPGHEEQGGPLAEAFLTRIDAPNEIKDRVAPLVKHHLAHLQMASDRSVRRLANALAARHHRGTVPGHDRGPVRTSAQTARGSCGRGQIAGQGGAAPPARRRAQTPAARSPSDRARPETRARDSARCSGKAFEAQLEGEFTDLEGAQQWLDRRL